MVSKRFTSRENNEGTTVKILLFEQQPMIRLGIRTLLEATEDLMLVGEVLDLGELPWIVESKRPHVVILDLGSGYEETAVEVCRRIKDKDDAPYVVGFADFRSKYESEIASRLSRLDSYLDKKQAPEKLIEMLRRTCAGEKLVVS